MTLYFYESIADHEYIGPVIVAAATESAWRGGATWVVNDLELRTEASGQDRE